MTQVAGDVHRTAAHAARTSFGRIVSLLATRNGDLAEAEDAVASALERALVSWPVTGVPDNPEAWLLTVARNRQRDAWRSAASRTGAELDLEDPRLIAAIDRIDPDAIGDRRLELLFACAHPAIDPAVRTPLMLQTALGFTAAQIAEAYGIPPAAFSKRLVRAKRRIRDAGVPFAIPDRRAMTDRLPAVLEAVYGCYAIAWRDADGRSHRAPDSMAGEALHLAANLATSLATESEAWSLAALISFSLSRARAREGAFIPLHEQDPALWDAALIADGETYLRRADELGGELGRFRLEAAMQAVHAERTNGAALDRAALRTLAEALVIIAPTAGSRIALAAITGQCDGAGAGLALLALMEHDGEHFAAYHAATADLLVRTNQHATASVAFLRAAELESDPPAAAFLRNMSAQHAELGSAPRARNALRDCVADTR